VAVLDPALAQEIDGLIVTVAREHSVLPNVDLGLAALAVAADLPDGATECLFMIARMAGFAAHILEEYPHGLRYRPRAVGSG
jgi:citrate synthase